jgi:hypothetical protein
MTEQKKLLMNFLIFFIPMVEMVYEEIQSLCNFLFLKIEPANKVQIFFRKTCLQCVLNIIFHIVHFTNRNGMKQSFPCMYDHHNSYNKGPNPTFFTFTESPSNSILTIKVPKNHITSFNHRNLPKTKLGRPFHGHQTGLRVNMHMKFLYPRT